MRSASAKFLASRAARRASIRPRISLSGIPVRIGFAKGHCKEGSHRFTNVHVAPPSERILRALSSQIADTATDIVVFSDFRHGIFNRDTIPRLTKSMPNNVFKVADSQVASRWGNILEFRGFDLITPNEREARFALGDQDSVVRPLGLELYRQAACRTLILKLGERGLLTFQSVPKKIEDVRAFFALDSFAERIVDAVGSGDALLAYAALALYSSEKPLIASVLGSLAAAVECEHEGNVPVSPKNVVDKLERFERLANFR